MFNRQGYSSGENRPTQLYRVASDGADDVSVLLPTIGLALSFETYERVVRTPIKQEPIANWYVALWREGTPEASTMAIWFLPSSASKFVQSGIEQKICQYVEGKSALQYIVIACDQSVYVLPIASCSAERIRLGIRHLLAGWIRDETPIPLPPAVRSLADAEALQAYLSALALRTTRVLIAVETERAIRDAEFTAALEALEANLTSISNRRNGN